MAKISTNSNVYTIVYAVVLVIIVAFLLAFAHSALSEKQTANVKFDTKKQILASLNVEVSDADADFNRYVKNILNVEGDTLDVKVSDFDVKGSDCNSVVYQCEVNGAVKYIIPLTGNGLWDKIWGYVALNEDRSTIYGIYFNHAGETPGLGAEIVTDGFRKPFEGKQVVKSVAVNDSVSEKVLKSVLVLKKGVNSENGEDRVDGISGGTITSTAVSDMLKSCFSNYKNFLTK